MQANNYTKEGKQTIKSAQNKPKKFRIPNLFTL